MPADIDTDRFFKSQKDPLTLLAQWISEGKQNASLREPTAMTVTTLGTNLQLHSRVVLLKGDDPQRLVFYTNYNSIKGQDLAENTQIAALFFWDALARQVRISGHARPITRAESEAYWQSRPRESQLSQWVSQQSIMIQDRQYLESLIQSARQQFQGRDIPCPEHWGGYIIEPELIEFWLGRENRLHDRFQFTKSASHWTCVRLAP